MFNAQCTPGQCGWRHRAPLVKGKQLVWQVTVDVEHADTDDVIVDALLFTEETQLLADRSPPLLASSSPPAHMLPQLVNVCDQRTSIGQYSPSHVFIARTVTWCYNNVFVR